MRNLHNMFDTEPLSFHNEILIECLMDGNPWDILEHALEQIYDELYQLSGIFIVPDISLRGNSRE
ncbi:hypothetical protein [Bacteroides faecalis]|nr:hypothetical protein [Bacteroides faecalis]